MFAPAHEKAFYKAILTFAAGDVHGALLLFRDASEKDTNERTVSDDLFAGLLSAQMKDDPSAIWYLEKVVRSDLPLPDALMRKYVPGGGLAIGVTETVTVEATFGSLAAALTLAEVYQRNDREDEAIGLLQQIAEAAPHDFITLSLCELLFDEESYEEVIELAAGIPNEDDVSLAIRLFQSQALAAKGMDEPALEVARECLRSKKRDAELLKEAKYMRGTTYLRLGKKAQGRKDLAGVYADDPSYRDVAELLNATA